MKPAARVRRPEEIELKLALTTSEPAGLAKRLARTPLLARRQATRQRLHNIYYDTPEQSLRKAHVALRLRRVGSGANAQWLQTLKTAGEGVSALSRRGEWETAVAGPALEWGAMEGSPWPAIDPDGVVFPALRPCFVTDFERTRWLVRRRDRSVVEVALDVGEIAVGDRRAPVCELEFELLAGEPSALFELAGQIAHGIAVLPSSMSKAERGYALAQQTLDAPLRAQPPRLSARLALSDASRLVLREMFGQFIANLNVLRGSDDPEVVHQARVGWRRFKGACRLFRPVPAGAGAPPSLPLRSLLTLLGELRDLDVALTETLPPLADAYMGGDTRRTKAWQALVHALSEAATLQRKAVRYALEEPGVGAALLAITQWLEGSMERSGPESAAAEQKLTARRWARHRMTQLHKRLRQARKVAGDAASQHRVRILAKRLRYSIEALRNLLPKHRAQRWLEEAEGLQASLGADRDVTQVAVIAASLDIDAGVVEFLRGVALGRKSAE